MRQVDKYKCLVQAVFMDSGFGVFGVAGAGFLFIFQVISISWYTKLLINT